MSPEERQLRGKLPGLRSSHSHIRNALGPHGEGTAAQRRKLKQMKEAAGRLAKQLAQLKKKKTKPQNPLCTTKAVLDHHLAAFDSGKVKTILSDYALDAVLLTPEGTFRGHKGIGPVIQRLLNDIFSTCSDFQMIRQAVQGDVAYIVWSAESERFRVPLATDTYLVRFGKIVIQTFTAEMKRK